MAEEPLTTSMLPRDGADRITDGSRTARRSGLSHWPGSHADDYHAHASVRGEVTPYAGGGLGDRSPLLRSGRRPQRESR